MHPQPSYARNRADEAGLLAHFEAVDAYFVPALSTRVDLRGYAAKLCARAERFEAWSGPAVVGLVAVYCNMPAVAFVTSVSVLPAWQGRGVARELLRKCLRHVQHVGLTSVALEVSPRATSAVSLYQALGFVIEAQDDSRLELRLDLQLHGTPSTT